MFARSCKRGIMHSDRMRRSFYLLVHAFWRVHSNRSQAHRSQFDVNNILTASDIIYGPRGKLRPGKIVPGRAINIPAASTDIKRATCTYLIRQQLWLGTYYGFFRPFRFAPLAFSTLDWFALRRWLIIEACVSIYRKATRKCSVTALINSYFN